MPNGNIPWVKAFYCGEGIHHIDYRQFSVAIDSCTLAKSVAVGCQ